MENINTRLTNKQIADHLDAAMRRYNEDAAHYAHTSSYSTAAEDDRGCPLAYSWEKDTISETEYISQVADEEITLANREMGLGAGAVLVGAACEVASFMAFNRHKKQGRDASLKEVLTGSILSTLATYLVSNGAGAAIFGFKRLGNSYSRAHHSAEDLLRNAKKDRTINVYKKVPVDKKH